MGWLRQSTAGQVILLGTFVDAADGFTAKTALTIAASDIKLWKEGATTTANKNSGGATHISGGRYYATLDATDSNTLGKMEAHVHVAGARPIVREFMVLPANVYDSLVASRDTLRTDARSILFSEGFDLDDGNLAGQNEWVNTLSGGGSLQVVSGVMDTTTANGGTVAGADRPLPAGASLAGDWELSLRLKFISTTGGDPGFLFGFETGHTGGVAFELRFYDAAAVCSWQSFNFSGTVGDGDLDIATAHNTFFTCTIRKIGQQITRLKDGVVVASGIADTDFSALTGRLWMDQEAGDLPGTSARWVCSSYEFRQLSGASLAAAADVDALSDSLPSDIAASISTTADLSIYAPATGSTIDLFRGDNFSAAPMTVTKSSSETHWPATLSTVHAWVRPKANLIALDSDASGMPALVTATSLVSSSTTATLTLPSGHGLVSGIMAISGATPDVYNGYFNVTVSGNTATYTFAGSTTATASGTIKVQAGIACTVTSATGSSQAFTFGPTMQQTVLLSAAASNGYDFHFVANVASVPRMLRSGTLNSRRSPAGA